MSDRTLLRRRFREAGVTVEDAVEAFTGLHPFHGGTGTWELLLTRHRLIERRGRTLTVWGAFSGPAPTKPLRTFTVKDLALAARGSGRGPAGRYDRVTLAGKTFWTAVDDRDIVQTWLAAAGEAGRTDAGNLP